jgi:outer membrane protein assembly factor BamB
MNRMWAFGIVVLALWTAPAGAGDSLADWELEFRGEVYRAAVGMECSYYMLHTPNSSGNAPGRNARYVSDSNGSPTSVPFVLVCVNHTDGKVRWARGFKHSHMSVDPRNDNVHVYDRRCITLGAKDGKVLKTTSSLPKWTLFDGVMIGSNILSDKIPLLMTRTGRKWLLAHPDSGRKLHMDVVAKRLLSPDEKWRLRIESDGRHHRLSCYTVGDNRKVWSYSRQVAPPVLFAQIPILTKGRIYWLNGSPSRRTELICLDSAGGKTIWSRIMPDGFFRASQHQFRGGAYPNDFEPLWMEGDNPATLDAAGRLHVLSAATGKTLWTFHPSRRYLCPPVVRGEYLIVCTHDSIRRYRLASIREPGARKALLAKARKLLKSDHADKALAMGLRAIKHDADFAGAYLLVAKALEQLGRDDEGLFFRAQSLALSGGGTDPVLLSKIGLERVIALGSPAAGLRCVAIENSVLAGTRDGRLVAIDTQTLEPRCVAQADNEIVNLYSSRSSLQVSDGSSRGTPHVISLQKKLNEPSGVTDKLWQVAMNRAGPSVFYRGDYYHPVRRGVVRWSTQQGKSIRYNTPLQLGDSLTSGYKAWWICLTASGSQYGYGPGGVAILDDHLCPSKWLLRMPKGYVYALQSGSEHFGGMFWQNETKRQMRIYSRQGKLIRATASSGLSYWRYPGQFIRHNGGYLLSGMEWLYMHPDSEAPIVRLGRPTAADTSQISHAWGGRFSLFGPPIVANDRLFVITRDGCVYVFDAAFFGRKRPVATKHKT